MLNEDWIIAHDNRQIAAFLPAGSLIRCIARVWSSSWSM